ncbi:Protein Skeletor, isoforms D/E [Pseudolycoriella hygida]|uniref:Protein Skeletor, isoforms D/E n=1 Tax=Pseudolycoriella hygida TaxID=35572 RepID=A0A9Q0RYU5_9DIPT|nr:Protein Skeletor, isoforms D/E [Pseudolycoriella hygida]
MKFGMQNYFELMKQDGKSTVSHLTYDWGENFTLKIWQKYPVVCNVSATKELDNYLWKAPVEPYYGRFIGPLKQFGHGIKGDLYAVDESTIFLKGFSYDGTGPDAFFWVGKTPRPSPEGYIIPYPEDYIGRAP